MAENYEFVARLRVAMAPEAQELLGRMPEKDMQEAFLGALVDAGYPAVTGASLARIMGLV